MRISTYITTLAVALGTSGCTTSNTVPDNYAPAISLSSEWQKDFGITNRNLITTGRNPYFVLEPGFQLVLDGDDEQLIITVLNDTNTVDGIATRVVEEREWKEGKLVEVSRNFFAIDKNTADVFYFGEEVDMYKGDKVVGHEGSWQAGKDNAKPGMIMPGSPTVGMKYCQEVAPEVAMDRAMVISISETLKTSAGTFTKCLKTQEGSALNPEEKAFKIYAPGIGLIRDADFRLAKSGFVNK